MPQVGRAGVHAAVRKNKRRRQKARDEAAEFVGVDALAEPVLPGNAVATAPVNPRPTPAPRDTGCCVIC